MTRTTSVVCGLLLLSFAPRAFADEAPPPVTAAPPGAAETAAAPPAAPVAAPSAPAEPVPPPKSPLTTQAFVDAYGSINADMPKPSGGANRFRAFDGDAGFALAWAGINLDYATEHVGATMHLRLGPATRPYALKDSGQPTELAKQAYVTYKPSETIAFDLGKFDSPFGYEVGDSQANVSYTRAFLYTLGQPFFHTGLRASATFGIVELKAIAVNGWNNTVDDNSGKTFGGQIGIVPSPSFAVRVGGIVGPEQPDTATENGAKVSVPGANGRLRALGDLIVTAAPTEHLSLAFNADYATEKIVEGGVTRTARWYGGLVAARVGIGEMFGVAVRGEWYHDDGAVTTGLLDANGQGQSVSLASGALTLEAAPAKNLLIRLEPRVDHANDAVFKKGLDGTTANQKTLTLGVVARTD